MFPYLFLLFLSLPSLVSSERHSPARRKHLKRASSLQPQTFTSTLYRSTSTGGSLSDFTLAQAERVRGILAVGNASSALTEQTVYQYLTVIEIGEPANQYYVVLDTGSANLWVSNLTITNSSISTNEETGVAYGDTGSVFWAGIEYLDTVNLAPGLTITNQSVGDATYTSGLSGLTGILGIGPEDLTENTVEGITELPTVVQTAFAQGLIGQAIVGIYFQPSTAFDVLTGEIVYGGYDISKITSLISWTPRTGTYASWWGIEVGLSVGSICYGTNISAFVDTGTTLIYIPDAAYNAYVAALPNATLDNNSGLLKFPKSGITNAVVQIPSVNLTINETNFTLNAYAQLVEMELYTAMGLDVAYYYTWIASQDEVGGFIIGQKFLERYYSIYDTTNNQVGFAYTEYSLPVTPP